MTAATNERKHNQTRAPRDRMELSANTTVLTKYTQNTMNNDTRATHQVLPIVKLHERPTTRNIATYAFRRLYLYWPALISVATSVFTHREGLPHILSVWTTLPRHRQWTWRMRTSCQSSNHNEDIPDKGVYAPRLHTHPHPQELRAFRWLCRTKHPQQKTTRPATPTDHPCTACQGKELV
jgi:hypothetical protein